MHPTRGIRFVFVSILFLVILLLVNDYIENITFVVTIYWRQTELY